MSKSSKKAIQSAPNQLSVPDVCPLCSKALVKVAGRDGAEIGIVSEFPGKYELARKVPFVSTAPAGRILRAELSRIGLEFDDLRVTNIWRHEPSSADGELEWHKAQAIRAVKNCKFILLLGSDASDAFIGGGVMQWSGLWVETPLLPGKHIMVGPNPASLIHGTLGEFRLALLRFREGLDNEEIARPTPRQWTRPVPSLAEPPKLLEQPRQADVKKRKGQRR